MFRNARNIRRPVRKRNNKQIPTDMLLINNLYGGFFSDWEKGTEEFSPPVLGGKFATVLKKQMGYIHSTVKEEIIKNVFLIKNDIFLTFNIICI